MSRQKDVRNFLIVLKYSFDDFEQVVLGLVCFSVRRKNKIQFLQVRSPNTVSCICPFSYQDCVASTHLQNIQMSCHQNHLAEFPC